MLIPFMSRPSFPHYENPEMIEEPLKCASPQPVTLLVTDAGRIPAAVLTGVAAL